MATQKSLMKDCKVTVPSLIFTAVKKEARKNGMTAKAFTTMVLTQYLNNKGVEV